MLLRGLYWGIRCREFGRGVLVYPGVHIVHPEWVAIGDEVTIHKDTVIHVAAKDKAGTRPVVRIGNGVHLSFRTWIAGRVGITIGDRTGFGPNVVLQDYTHGYEDPDTPIEAQSMVGEKPITIGSGCFLAANVIVLPGTTIGDRCVIGGNAVVMGDIPSNSVAVGNPARVVRHYDRQRGEWVRV